MSNISPFLSVIDLIDLLGIKEYVVVDHLLALGIFPKAIIDSQQIPFMLVHPSDTSVLALPA